jgi:hypothetical protein
VPWSAPLPSLIPCRRCPRFPRPPLPPACRPGAVTTASPRYRFDLAPDERSELPLPASLRRGRRVLKCRSSRVSGRARRSSESGRPIPRGPRATRASPKCRRHTPHDRKKRPPDRATRHAPELPDPRRWRRRVGCVTTRPYSAFDVALTRAMAVASASPVAIANRTRAELNISPRR